MQSSGSTMLAKQSVEIEDGITRMSIGNSSAFPSLFTNSSGKQSQIGAQWRQDLTMTMQSGFAAGTLRSETYEGKVYKGVREGRERGGWLPGVMGVGRTGKEPARVPAGMLKALGVKVEEEDDVEVRPRSKKEIHGLPRSGTFRRQQSEIRETLHPVPIQPFSQEGSVVFDSRHNASLHLPLRTSPSSPPGTSQQGSHEMEKHVELLLRHARTEALSPAYTDQAMFASSLEWLLAKARSVTE